MINPILGPSQGKIVFGRAFAVGVAFLWSALAVASDTSWETQPYRLGEGLYFPQHALRVGGYADLQFFGLDRQHSAFSVEDLSLFLTKDIGPRWKLFSEIEIGDALTIVGHHASSGGATFDIERLYVDYYASTVATIRFGEFLTPVGQWNLVHADPLVWTASRPLTTTAAFSRHAAGAMMYGTVNVGNNDLDYWLYVDDAEALRLVRKHDLTYDAYGATSTSRNAFLHAAGGQFLYHMLGDRLSLGASFVSYELENPRQQYRLAGVDFDWVGGNIELSAEGVYRTADNPQTPDEYGGFLQAVVPLPRHLYLVGRYERFRNSIPNEIATIRTIGINYRPLPSIVLKFERDDSTHSDATFPSGWFASVGVIF